MNATFAMSDGSLALFVRTSFDLKTRSKTLNHSQNRKFLLQSATDGKSSNRIVT